MKAWVMPVGCKGVDELKLVDRPDPTPTLSAESFMAPRRCVGKNTSVLFGREATMLKTRRGRWGEM